MKKILVLITAIFLFGCNEKTYTVSDFENNRELRDEYNKKCQNGEIDGDSLNCQNVFDALLSIGTPERNPNAWK